MKRYLILENGLTFEGQAFGANLPAEGVIAEIVFTSAMTGFLETLTDKSYFGQAIIQTFPLIGNYGVILEDAENVGAKVACSAYIVREQCEKPSNFRCQMTLDEFLKKNNVPGLCGIDTRSLTKTLCRFGTMNGIICNDLAEVDMEKIKAYRVAQAVESVTCIEKRVVQGIGGAPKAATTVRPQDGRGGWSDSGTPESPVAACRHAPKNLKSVAILDFGVKENIVRSLASRGCNVTVFPALTPASEILAINPDGIMLSNGPGDPQNNPKIIATIKELLQHKIPMMGICLGHQLLALANGFYTEKLKFGHRGANQPVKDLKTGNVYISSQNHGYAVKNDSIKAEVAEPYFENVNDKSNEGLLYKNIPAFSVQFHPEACGGPKDTIWLFDKFIETMEK